MNRLELTKFASLDYACSEAMNTLCTNLSFCGDNIRKIMVTSARPADGKTFLTMNMMRTLAGLRKKVVMVDADLRRSSIKEKYGLQFLGENKQGLTHYLAGMCKMEDIVYGTNITNAYMVPVGQDVLNSLQLLSTPRLPALLQYLAEQFDVVLLDTSPMGIIVDAAEIAKCCDGAVLAVAYNKIGRRELMDVHNIIRLAGCEILGAVLNGVELNSYSNRRFYYKTYYYSHMYKNDDKPSWIKGRSPQKTKAPKTG